MSYTNVEYRTDRRGRLFKTIPNIDENLLHLRTQINTNLASLDSGATTYTDNQVSPINTKLNTKLNYSILSFALQQAGTNVPEMITLTNQLGDIDWARGGVGAYTGTYDGWDLQDKMLAGKVKIGDSQVHHTAVCPLIDKNGSLKYMTVKVLYDKIEVKTYAADLSTAAELSEISPDVTTTTTTSTTTTGTTTTGTTTTGTTTTTPPATTALLYIPEIRVYD